MAKRIRSWRLDERMERIMEHARQLNELGLGAPVVHTEYVFWAMMFADREHVRGLLSGARGEAFDTALRKTRAYAAVPMRSLHHAKDEELEWGESEKLRELFRVAARIGGEMCDDDVVTVTPEILVAAADTNRVAEDIVFRCWGVGFKRMRSYYIEQGIMLPLTEAEKLLLLMHDGGESPIANDIAEGFRKELEKS